jgi:hypothetical protein
MRACYRWPVVQTWQETLGLISGLIDRCANGSAVLKCKRRRPKGEPGAAAPLMKPANEDLLVGRPVNKAIGNVKNNTPDPLA